MSISVRAQLDPIEIGSVVDSSIASDQAQSWQLIALETSIISFHVETLEGNLDPIIRVIDSSGTIVMMNDDYDYPDSHSALIQAFAMPRTDTYTVEVSGFGDTAGSFRLSVLQGFDQLAIHDTATSTNDWQVANPNIMSVAQIESGLTAEIQGIAVTSNIIATHFPVESDYYYEAQFANINASSSWQVGIIFHYVNPSLYYRLVVNDQGFWQLELINGDTMTVIESWTTHPAIVPGAPEFTLGILVSGTSYDILYDRQVIGTVYDTQHLKTGNVGVTAITANALSSRVAFTLESAQMTLPTAVDDDFVFPETLFASNYTSLVHTLERQQAIPIGGEVKLTAPQITIQYANPGISRFVVADGIEFTEFVLGATLNWTIIGEGNGGCGITFNDAGDQDFSIAYINSQGEYGVSRRNSDKFDPGIYGDTLDPSIISHSIIIIVSDGQLYYYVDNHHVATMDYTAVSGEIGTAIVNFDGVDTSCTFDNIWLWSLDTISS